MWKSTHAKTYFAVALWDAFCALWNFLRKATAVLVYRAICLSNNFNDRIDTETRRQIDRQQDRPTKVRQTKDRQKKQTEKQKTDRLKT